MIQAKPTRPSRRLNPRALTTLGALLLVSLIGLVALKAYQDRNGRKGFLAQAKERVAKHQTSLALGYLNRYLELKPDDPEALDLKARILSDGAGNEAQAVEAVTALGQVLGRATDEGRKQEVRRRLARLNLMIPDRARSALAQARDLIRYGADDAEAHRLLARALGRLGYQEKSAARTDEALKEFLRAEAKDPGDVEGAEHLAALYRDQLEDPAKAQGVLDRLVSSTVKAPKTHATALLARARHYHAIREPAKAQADVLRATRDDPGDLSVRVAAAESALQRRDTSAARLHLAAIAPEHRDNLRVKITEGLIDLVEQRPDDAITTWRAGLLKTSGNDADLTWRLAHVLLSNGRAAEAQPLLDQYRRLTGGENPNPRYRYLHALSLLKINHPAEAVPELENLRYKIDKPLRPELLFTLGEAYQATRDDARALEAYLQSAEISDDWTGPWVSAARLQEVSRPEESIATLRTGLAANPGNPNLLTALAQFVWRDQMRKPGPQRNWSTLEEALAEARRAAPGSVDLALVESDYFLAVDRADDAIALLKTASGMNKRSPEIWIALVNTLVRRGQIGYALDTIDRAVAAAGPQAPFYVTRFSLLDLKGQSRESVKALQDGLARVPAEQKPLLWKTLGDSYLARKQSDKARSAYDEWVRLQPENPEARLALVELALATGDEPAIARAVDAVRGVGGPRGYHWRLARTEDLLRERPREAPDRDRTAARLAEAETLIREIQRNDPRLMLGYLLEGRLRERQKRTDQAIAAYEEALKRDAGPLALNPLVALLVREGRDQELQELNHRPATTPGEVDRMAAVLALKMGNKDRAEQLAAMAVQGDPRGIDTGVWQAQVLKALGKPEEAEAALRVLTGRQPTQASPWLQLLMLQVSQGQKARAAETVAQIRSRVETKYPELLWAQCYRSVGDNRQAGECFREALRRWPDDLGVLGAAVAYYEQTGRRDEAEGVLRTVLRQDPSNGAAVRKLALSRAGHPGNRAAWDEAVRLAGADPRPDDVPEDQLTRAAVYALGPDPGHRKKAVAILESLLAEQPDRAKAHDQLARLLFAAGDLPRARDHAARAASGEDASPETILFHAGVLLALNDVSAAEGEIDRLAAIAPDTMPLNELKARALSARGKGEEGARLLVTAWEDRASSPDAVTSGKMMVSLLTTLHQPEAAARVARKLGELGPRGRCVLAEFLAGTGKADDAFSLLQETAKAGEPATAGATALYLASRPGADPRWVGLAGRFLEASGKNAAPSFERLQQVASLRHLQGRYEQEVAAYEAMLTLPPPGFLFLNNMAWTLSEELGRPREGLKRADEAIQKVGRQPHLLDTRGVILTRLDRLPEAVNDLGYAANELKEASVYYHLARAYHKMGKPDEVRRYRDLARKGGLAREQLQRSELADWDTVMNP